MMANRGPSALRTLGGVAVGLIAMAVGCSSPAEEGAETSIEPAGPTISIDTSAGEAEEVATFGLELAGPHVAVVIDDGADCGDGPCRTVLELAADGQWLLRRSDGSREVGGFDSEAIVAQANSLDPDQVILGPFQGQCPRLAGGVERFYQAFSADDPQVPILDVSTCVDQIDADVPLIVALDLLFAEATL